MTAVEKEEIQTNKKTMKRARRRKHNHHRGKKEDRLSNLPDCVLLQILSSLDIKLAVQTLILSKRWKNVWKRLSNLTIIPSYFTNIERFNEFVDHFFSLRDSSSSLHILYCHQYGIIKPQLLNRMVDYAVSHNVQQLNISVTCDGQSLQPDVQYIPSILFSCQTLTSLDLSVDCLEIYATRWRTIFPNSPNLPELISLSLQSFSFLAGDDGCAEPFSALSKLKSLIIKKCEVLSCRDNFNLNLCISNNTLDNLTIIMPESEDDVTDFGIELSTPSLCTFDFTGIPIQKLCGSESNLSSIKDVNIDVDWDSGTKDTAKVLLLWLVELANIESLEVTLSTLKVLSLIPNIMKYQFPSLYNLKSLKVIKHYNPTSSVPEKIVKFLLQNAPSAEVTTDNWLSESHDQDPTSLEWNEDES